METGERKRETVLVTGATGFLGEYLVRQLTGEYRVLALGRNRERGKKLEELGAQYCHGDFTDVKSCGRYFKGVQYVIHAGALSTVWGRWEDFFNTNVLGTSLVAGLCLKNQIKRLVYISSPSIYTEKKDRYRIREDQAPRKNNLNCYIKSKLMAEEVIRRWNRKGLETVVLRPRGLIGVGDTSLAPRLLRANTRVGIPLFNGGKNIVDLTSVENVALACRLALKAEKASGQTFNITNGEPMEFKTILESFLESIGEKPRYRNLPFGAVYAAAGFLEGIYRIFGLKGEPPLTRYTVCTLGFAQTMDIRKARTILGYSPEKTLAESIQEYGGWWKGKDQKKTIQDPPSKVTKVRLYHCGSCANNLRLLFKGRGREIREFPAMAALICHKNQGNLLFDTGYSEQIYQGGFFLKLYRLLNPVRLEKDQTIASKLLQDGISPDSVKTIILSHAHPDHIGGLSLFEGYGLAASDEVMNALERHRLSDLVFKNMVPEKGAVRKKIRLENQLKQHFLCQYFDRVYDLFGDGSVIGVILEGHCKGQMGIWLPDFSLFLAADACWGNDLISSTPKMKLLPRLIQKDFKLYKKTLEKLCALKHDYPEIKIVFSHQRGREKLYD